VSDHTKTEEVRKRPLENTQLLLDNGAQVDVRDEDGNTPLILAAKGARRPETIQLLIEKGAKVNARNKDGWTPLMIAARGAGTQFRDWNNHLTPFHIVELLLDKGANPLAKDASGMKAIDHARHNKALKDTPALKKLAELSGE
jgi:death-associated protein kinase